jgi:voltage-gated sodium channel
MLDKRLTSPKLPVNTVIRESEMQQKIRIWVESRGFEYLIVSVIILNAIILGLETDAAIMSNWGDLLHFGNRAILAIFIIEAALKIYAVAPRLRLYFGSGWNLFDFTVVVLSLIPAAGEYAMIARLARLLRVARLVTAIPELRLIVATLVRSIPSMGNIMLLMSVIFYIYAIAGYHLFHEADPTHWHNLGISLLTLFRVVTLEDWTDVMYSAMQVYPWSWVYFVSFVVVGTFVVVNLFIAVVINNLEQAKQERLESLREPVTVDELMRELDQTRLALVKLQNRLDRSDRVQS